MDQPWTLWGVRLTAHVREAKIKWGAVAEHMGVGESGLRHWRNGTRQLNIDDFFKLCAFVKADPRTILFGPLTLSDEEKRRLGEAVASALRLDTGSDAKRTKPQQSRGPPRYPAFPGEQRKPRPIRRRAAPG